MTLCTFGVTARLPLDVANFSLGLNNFFLNNTTFIVHALKKRRTRTSYDVHFSDCSRQNKALKFRVLGLKLKFLSVSLSFFLLYELHYFYNCSQILSD